MVANEPDKATVRDSKIQAAITRFMDSKDIPPWYRAFSKFQLAAADELQSAIRDDVEQETTHRIRHCLSVLGLVPLLNNKHLQILMKLSGGNDLAFLWFLMEFHYKTPGDTQYSINEQIILSGIAHLDMITTLRGLDRVLPPGHLSKRTIAKFRAKIQQGVKKRSTKLDCNKENGPKWRKLQPYFRKLERPREPNQSFLESARPDFKVKFREYEKYKDASYQPPNEANRWFTFYHIHDALRVSVVELRSLFDDFFKTIDLRTSRQSTALRIIDQALDQIDQGHGCDWNEPSLCLVHQAEKDQLEEMRRIREEEKNKRCLKKLDLIHTAKKKRIARIQEALMKDVEMYRKQIREDLKKDDDKKHVLVLDKDAYSEHSILVKDCCQHEPECIKPDRTAGPNKVVDAAAGITTTPKTHAQEEIKQDRPSRTSRSSSRGSRKSKSKSKEKKAEKGTRASKAPKEKGKRARGGGISFNRLSHSRLSFAERRASRRGSYYDYAKIIPKQPSQTFFQAATPNQPYKFLYENIFNDEYNVEDSEKFIKNVVVEALNSKKHHHQEEELRTTPRKLSIHPDVGKAAKKYINDIWEKELATQRAIIHDTRKAIGLESAEDLTAQNHMPDKILPSEMPILDFYDCEDKELMHRMLEIGLNALAKNRKYVLASIPNAHKLPDLREWIYQRYGKTYTQAEREADYRASQQLLTWLIKMKVNVKMLSPRDIAKNNVQTYACHNYLRKKVGKFRNAYFNRVSIANMEFARLVWFSMNNYLCSISQRGVFFSYLPQRIKDLHLINPWKLHHIKNMKTLWEQRQVKKAQEARLKF